MRLLTRSDFDGVACGALLKAQGVIDSWKFVHPKDMQDGIVEVTANDVLANVPYVPGCGMWFDHHKSEVARIGRDAVAPGQWGDKPSAAHVIYDYYGGKDAMPGFEHMIEAVDKVDSGHLTKDEIENPQGWVLLGFIMDPRTGLGRFKDFKTPGLALVEKLIHDLSVMDIDELLALPDVKERVDMYWEQNALFRDMISKHTHTEGNVIITDLRNVSPIYSGNRFLVYGMYPEQNVSLWVVDGRDKQNCPIAVGYSVLNRTCTVDIGLLMLKFGGGGHPMVGTCQVDYDKADETITEIVQALCALDTPFSAAYNNIASGRGANPHRW